MNDEEVQQLSGRIKGLELVLMSLIQGMDDQRAASAKTDLQMFLDLEKELDEDEDGFINPPAESAARNQTAEGFIRVLARKR